MLNRLAIKEIKNCKSQTIMLGLTSLLGSISIVGQAWYFANLINNFIFLNFNVFDFYKSTIK